MKGLFLSDRCELRTLSEPVSYVKFACLQAFKSSQTLFGRVWQAYFIINTALEETSRQISAELS